MKIRAPRLPMLTLVAGALSYACGEQTSPLGLAEAGTTLDARNGGLVASPFKASLYTDLVSLAPDPICGAPPWVLNVQAGEGEATGLGRFSVHITFCVDATDLLDDGTLTEGESAPYVLGSGTLVAANGDELYMTIEGAVLPSSHPDYAFEFFDPWEFVGGTGRFAGASGAGVTSSFVDFTATPSRTHHTWTGMIEIPR